MTPRTLAVTSLVLLVLGAVSASSAAATPKDGTFETTFPVASKLCAKADAGSLPAKLAASSDAVSTACTTLRTDYAATLATFTTAVTPLKQQATDAVAAAKTACASGDSSSTTDQIRPGAGGSNRPSAACRQARTAARATLRQLRSQVMALTKTYRTGVRAERAAFWSTIHGLRGGAATPADPATATPTSPPATIPADSSVS